MAEHTIDNNLACSVHWWTCCHLACREYYIKWLSSCLTIAWHDWHMITVLSPCWRSILLTTNWHVWYRLLSCLCFASYKHSHRSIIIVKSFGNTFFASTSFQFVSWRVCIMAGIRAGAITAAAKAVSKSHENEKRRKSAARTCKWRDCQSGERQSEIRQTDLTGHTEGCACLPEEQWSEIRQNDLTGHAEGHACLSEKWQSEIQQTHWMGHAEGHASLSAERQSEIRQTNLTRHAEGCTRLKTEEE
jgi:hypothetical protein